MNIQFDKDINLFGNLNDLQIIKKLPSYKKYYKEIFIQYIEELHFDIQYIESIHIIHNKPSYGTTKHNMKDGQMYFTIELYHMYQIFKIQQIHLKQSPLFNMKYVTVSK